MTTDTVQTEDNQTTNQTDADQNTDVDQSDNTTDVQTEDAQNTDADQSDDKGDDQPTDNDQSDDKGDDGNQNDETTYADFEMKEGQQLDPEALELAKPIFKESGLTQEQAQKQIDLYSDLVQAGAKKQVDAFNEQVANWRKDSENDSEFGGEAFEENVKHAQAAVNNFGTPELKQLLEDYGVGNHPEIIRFMVKVGKLTAEDVPGGDTNNTAAGKATDRVSILYPNARKS